MTLLQGFSRFPAHVAEDVSRPGRLDDGDIGSLDERVQRSRRLGVSRVGDELAFDPDAVAVGAARPVVELDGFVLVPRRLAGRLGRFVSDLEARPHHRLPVGSPADLPQSLEPLLDAGRADKCDRARIYENAVMDETRQAHRLAAVEMRE